MGSDVVALYPSLTARRTGEIVQRRVLKSELKFPRFCADRGLLYIKFNEDKTGDLEVVRALYPERRFTSGTEPSIASIGASWDPEDQWRYKQHRYTKVQRKEVIAWVVSGSLHKLLLQVCQ